MAVRWLASPSWRYSLHSIKCAAVSHEKRDDNGSLPPFSSDLAPSDFFLFPRMKRDLKGKRFQNVEEVREKQRRHWRLSLCKSSMTVLNNGKSCGISVLLLKDSILKVIKLWKCSEKYTFFFFKKKSRYFWVPHICAFFRMQRRNKLKHDTETTTLYRAHQREKKGLLQRNRELRNTVRSLKVSAAYIHLTA